MLIYSLNLSQKETGELKKAVCKEGNSKMFNNLQTRRLYSSDLSAEEHITRSLIYDLNPATDTKGRC